MTRRTTYRILAGLSLALAALLLAVWVTVRTAWFREWLRDQVTATVNGSINGNLTIDAISGSLFSDVTLQGVALYESGEPVATVERIEASYNLLEMISGAIRLDHLQITRPVVRLVRDERGWNVTRIADVDPAPEQPESALVLSIASAAIDDGRIHVFMDGEQVGDLSQVALRAAVAVDPAGTAVDLERLSLYDERSRTPIELHDATARLTDTATTIDDVRLVTPDLEFTGQATMPVGDEPASLEALLQFDQWAANRYAVYLPEDVADLPPISGDLSVAGPLDALVARWRLEMAEAATSGEITSDVTADRLPVAGRLSVADLDPSVVTGRADLAGRVTADAVVDLALDLDDLAQSSGTITLAAGPVAVSGYRVEQLNADARLGDEGLTVDGNVAAYGARTRATISVTDPLDPAARVVSAAGRIDELNVAALPESTGRPDLPTALSGTYTARLAGSSWDVTFRGDESTIADATIAAGSTVSAEGRNGSVAVELGADVRDVSGDLLGAAATSTRLAGRIDATASIPDTASPNLLDTATASVRAVIADSTVYGHELTTARLDAELADGVVRVAELDVQAPGLSLEGGGLVAAGAKATAESNLEYRLDVPDLAALPEALVQVSGLRGGALVTGTMTGPADHPAVNGTLHLSEAGYGETASALTINGTYGAELPGRDVERLAVDLDLDGTFLTIGGQDVQALGLSGRYEAQRVDLTAIIEQEARSIEIDGGLAILPEYREIVLRQLAITGEGEPWRLEPDADGVTTMQYGPASVEMEPFALVRGAERIAVEGRVGLDDSRSSDASLTLQNLDVAQLLTLATGASIVAGTANGTIDLAGTIADPDVDASLTISDGAVADVPFGVARADVQIAGRVANVDGRVEELHGAALDVSGTVPLTSEAEAPLDVRVTSDTISLGLLASFTTHLSEIEGAAAIDVRAEGTLDDPRLSGTVQLADAAFTVTPTGVRYGDVDLSARLDGDAIHFDRATITDEAGQVLTLTGQGILLGDAAARTLAVEVRGEEFRVLNNQLGEVELTIDARIDGQLTSPNVVGRIAVDRGRLEVDEVLMLVADEGPSAPVVTPVAADETPPGAAAAVEAAPAGEAGVAPTPPAETDVEAAAPAGGTIELELVMPDNVVLRGENIRTSTGSLGLGDMNMTVGGTIALRKGADAPLRLVGAVEVIRGFYEFQGRRFEISEGSAIRFRGADTIDPALAVTGTRDVSGVTAQVEVTGTAREPRLALSSNPPLDEGDVLSLIVFNQPVSQLGEGEQVDLLDRAGDVALGALATSLADSLGQAFDVDLFEIRAPSSTGAGDVTVGTQVSERLFVGFRQEFGSAGASQLSFEYRLTEFLRLLTSVSHGSDRSRSTGDRESTGADLVFRVRY